MLGERGMLGVGGWGDMLGERGDTTNDAYIQSCVW